MSSDTADEAGAMFWQSEGGVDPGVTAKTSGLLSDGASENRTKLPEEGLGKRGPTP